MNALEKALAKKLGDSWMSATPGLKIRADFRGEKVVDFEVGRTYPYYDFASLTKILFSATAFMQAFDDRRYTLKDPVSRWVSWFPNERIQIKNLLTHSAGLTWWYPFYKAVSKKTDSRTSPDEAWTTLQKILQRKVSADFEKSGPAAVSTQAVYSDLDLFVLGAVLEAVTERDLLSNWARVKESLRLKDTNFHVGNRPLHAKSLYAPTENDPWRGRVLQGEVHDENAWSLKGVAPHAGLFGTLKDLSQFGLILRAQMRGESGRRRMASDETVRLFTQRAIPKTRGDWGLLYMMPTKGTTSCGPLFSSRSVGHTGFTGTSLWYDPDRDLLVTILSNRVHPTRENKEFVALRPKLHTWIAEEL